MIKLIIIDLIIIYFLVDGFLVDGFLIDGFFVDGFLVILEPEDFFLGAPPHLFTFFDLEPTDLDFLDFDPEDFEPEDLDFVDFDPEDFEPEDLDFVDFESEDLDFEPEDFLITPPKYSPELFSFRSRSCSSPQFSLESFSSPAPPRFIDFLDFDPELFLEDDLDVDFFLEDDFDPELFLEDDFDPEDFVDIFLDAFLAPPLDSSCFFTIFFSSFSSFSSFP